MFQALNEGIVLIKDEEIEFQNSRFKQLISEAEGSDQHDTMSLKFLMARKHETQRSSLIDRVESIKDLLTQD